MSLNWFQNESDGNTPLLLTVEHGYREVLDKGPPAPSTHSYKLTCTPPHVNAYAHSQCAELLVSKSADVTATNHKVKIHSFTHSHTHTLSQILTLSYSHRNDKRVERTNVYHLSRSLSPSPLSLSLSSSLSYILLSRSSFNLSSESDHHACCGQERRHGNDPLLCFPPAP